MRPPPKQAGKRRAPGPVANQPPKTPKAEGVFSGCTFCFWSLGHMQRMIERVRELGGVVEPALTPVTTHVVVRASEAAQCAARKLQACPPGRVCDTVVLEGGAVILLPHGLHVVMPTWVERSILCRARQAEADFLPPALKPVPQPLQPALPAAQAAQPAADQRGQGDSQQQQGQRQAQAPGSPAHSGAAASAAGQEQQQPGPASPLPQRPTARQPPASPPPATPGEAASERHEGATVEPAGAPAAAAAAVAAEQWEGVCEVVRRGLEFECVRGSKPRFTGGHTGIPWGSFGVWAEPYDESSARETTDKIRRFWYRMKDASGPAAAATPSATAASPAAAAAPVHTNGVCTHAACARRPYCLVERLSQVRVAYIPGKDPSWQFKIKQLDRAMLQLEQLPTALNTEEDVDAIQGMGTKAKEKVKDILEHGVSSRVLAAATNPESKAYALFMEVWGVGPRTAEKWIREGCTTLEDAGRRHDLSDQQRVSLKYFEDLRQRIPREEVALAESVVRRVVFELCERWGARDVERTYAQACGSYIRGEPSSGDIDMMICLPPSLAGRDCGEFLTELLINLLGEGLLLDEMSPRQRHEPSTHRASWMGLCRPPGGPHVRRIDIKVYGNAQTPYAVNYFANSMQFGRAMRYWALYAVPERAQRYSPEATGFKLGDAVTPIRRLHKGRGGRRGAASSGSDREEEGGEEHPVGPPIECKCETTIFEVLGLAYVPPHMRHFPSLG